VKNIKEREKFVNSNIYEGIVSFRAVTEAIENKGSSISIKKVFYDISKSKKRPKELSYIKAKSYKLGFEVELTNGETIDEMTLGNSHGGLCFVCSEKSLPHVSLNDIILNGFYVLLDGIEDPYNFGYSLRSLMAAGVDGILLPERNWMGASGVVCRASAGASELLDIFVINDYNDLALFKEKNYKIICADMDDSIPLYDADMKKPLLLVIGGEKRGISSAALSLADSIVRIEYGASFPAALSAASASTVIAFEVFRQNRN